MNAPYEVLIRNGIAAHALETPTSPARAVADGDWPVIVTGINTAALAKATEADQLIAQARKDAEDQVKAAKADAKTALDESAAAIVALKAENAAEIAELKKNHEVAFNDLKSSNAEVLSKIDTEWKVKLDDVNDKNSELIQETTVLKSEIDGLKKTIEDGRAILLTHQTETDRGMAIAGPLVEKLVATGDENALALAQVFAQFAEYSSAREEVKKKKELKELRAQKKALEEKISALNLAVGDAK